MSTGLYYNYLLYLPPSYGKVNKKWPLLLHLHTWSERGSNLESVRNFGISKVINNPLSAQPVFGETEFPFILVSPQCPSNNDTWREEELFTLL
jgi:predicted peptidase